MVVNEEFEQVLEAVGDKGRYQKLLLLLYVPLSFFIPWSVLCPIFIGSVPDHWCHVPGRNENISLNTWKKWTVPRIASEGVKKFDQCHQFKTITNSSHTTHEDDIVDCLRGWDYDDTWYEETLPSRNNWVCEDQNMVSDWMAMGQVGSSLGFLFFYPMADIIGRKKVVIIAGVLAGTSTLMTIAFPDGWLSLAVQVVSKFPLPTMVQVSAIWITEQVGLEWRHYVMMILFVGWTVGMSALPFVAWLAGNWRWLCITVSLPSFYVLVYCWLYESPRWMVTANRREGALKNLLKIARFNGKQDDDKIKEVFALYNPAQETTNPLTSFWQLCQSEKLKTWMFSLTVAAVSIHLVYFSLNYNNQNLGGNEFVNFFWISIVEFPSAFVGWLASETVGRRWGNVGLLLATSFFIGIPIFFDPESVTTLVCVIVAKCLINGNFYIYYLQTLEILPTSHRSFGFGIISLIPSIFTISSPYIAHSSSHWSKLPYVIMLGITTVGSIAAAFVPESLGQELPQTIPQSEEYFGNQEFWSYRGRNPKKWFSVIQDKTFPNKKK